MLYVESGLAMSRKIRQISCFACISYISRAIIPLFFVALKLAYPSLRTSVAFNYGLVVVLYGVLEIMMLTLLLHLLKVSEMQKHGNNITDSFVDVIGEPNHMSLDDE